MSGTRKSWAAVAEKTGATGPKSTPVRRKAVPRPSVDPKAPAKSLWRADHHPFLGLCRLYGLPEPVPEYRFDQARKWRFDYAWPKCLIALEVDGGIWTQGRHTRGKGVLGDHEKLNAAALAGWRVFRTTPAGLTAMLPMLKLALTPT